MTAYLSPVFGSGTQLFNNGGAELVGGKIFIYQAGTSTLIDTWTTSTQTIKNANPIILDSTGRVVNQIWLQGGNAYKFILQDPFGNQIGSTWDNIVGINDPSSNQSQWISTGLVPTYISSTKFSVVGNYTTTFTSLRRIQAIVTAGIIYGTISTSSYSLGYTTVTVTWDSTGLDSGLSQVNLENIFALASDISAPSGSSLIGFQQAGTGAVARTVQSKEQDTVNVFDFMTSAQITDVLARTMLVDVMAAVISATTFASLTGKKLICPSGLYLMNVANGSVQLQNCSLEGANVWCLTQPYEALGTCFAIKGTSVSPFLIQNNVTFSGINIWYPDQKNPVNAGAIIAYPPTFQQNLATAGVVAVQFENCMFFNMYDGFNIGTGNTYGPTGYITFSRCAMYAIRRLWSVSYAPTPIVINECQVGYGNYVAYDTSNVLSAYSIANGSLFYIYGDGTTLVYPSHTVEGVFCSNSSFGGYRYIVKIDTGALGSALFNNCAFDQIGNLVSLTTSGAIATTNFSDCWLDTYPNTYPLVDITAASPGAGIISDFTFDNVRSLFLNGGLLNVTTAGKVRSITVRNCNFQGVGNSGAGTWRLANIDEVNCVFVWENNTSVGSANTQSYGLNLTNVASTSRIDGSTFTNFYFPISTVSNSDIYVTNNITSGTNAGNTSLSGTGTNVHVNGNTFDQGIGLSPLVGTHQNGNTLIFYSAGKTQATVSGAISAANYPNLQGNVGGSPVLLTASGTDTDIDIEFVPKGAGAVRFGAYTGGVVAQAGYISVKDAGGTVRRLLVG